MRLKQVVIPESSTHFHVRCVGCDKQVNSHSQPTYPYNHRIPSQHKMYADLDGIPFVDYYCEGCADDFVSTVV